MWRLVCITRHSFLHAVKEKFSLSGKMKAALPLLLFLAACQEPVSRTEQTASDAPQTLCRVPPRDTASPEKVPTSPASNTLSPPEKYSAQTRRDSLLSFARQFLGVPYIYATSDPEKGFDCSGFIHYVYHHFGIPVPRSSIEYKTYGREISLTQAQTADLILFTGAHDTDRIGHIGIILQNKSDSTEFIHASSGKEMAVVISSVAAPHYKKRFVKVVDVIGH